MRKTIVRSYVVEILPDDIVRMRTHWRNARRLGDLSEGAEIGMEIQALVDLTDNGNRSFNEWLYMAYEAATFCVDVGDHSGCIYWAPKDGGWQPKYMIDHEYAVDQNEDVPVFDFGPITYVYHGHDGDCEAEHEDDFHADLEDEPVMGVPLEGVPELGVEKTVAALNNKVVDHSNAQAVQIGDHCVQNNTFL